MILGCNIIGEQYGREIQCIRLIGNYTRFFIRASYVNRADTRESARQRRKWVQAHTHTVSESRQDWWREWLEEKTTRGCRHLSLSHWDGSKMYFFPPPLVHEHFPKPSHAHSSCPPSAAQYTYIICIHPFPTHTHIYIHTYIYICVCAQYTRTWGSTFRVHIYIYYFGF